MLTEQLENNLLDIYFIIRDVPSWYEKCCRAEYTEEELEYLEKLDVELSSYRPRDEANAAFKDVRKGGGPDIFYLETDEEKLKALVQKMNDLSKRIQVYYRASDIDDFMELRYLFKKIRARQVHKDEKMDWTIPEWKISKAREYPLENLIGSGRRSCPFHQGEGKNFRVDGGFGYCYVCNEWADSIRWLMKIEGYSFRDAVERIVR